MPSSFDINREIGKVNSETKLTSEEASKYYLDENYETYLVEYTGDFIKRINSIDYAKAFFPGVFFAILFVKRGMLSRLLKEFPEIVNIERSFPYTPFNISESNELPDLNALNKGATTLNGNGVVVGIIGTGIDFLNPRFMDENDNSRIISIWDQSINEGPIPDGFIHGTEYTRDTINKAIAANTSGKNPYDIVKHRDELGNGTAIANIIGGKKLGAVDEIEGIAPKCEFIIVKLKESRKINREHWGIENYKGLVYDNVDIGAAGRYIAEMQQKVNKPTVIYVTGGTNLGAHDGSTVGERLANFLTQGTMLSGVISTGNQGGSPICYKSTFTLDEKEKVVEIDVDENQKNLFLILYYYEPDIISVGITSPGGETLSKIPLNPINGEEFSFTLGESTVYVQYFLEAKQAGKQRINFIIKNAQAGIWKINIIKEDVIRGELNIWLQQKEFSVGNTGLVAYTPLTTLMTPSTASNMIVTASYNQISNEVMQNSGRGFTIDNRVTPIVAISAKNIITVGLDNKPIVVSGSAVSGAILAGVVALLYQWGIVQKNDINMYPVKIKTYLIQGTVRDKDKTYPNPEVGYGFLDIKTLLAKLNKRQNENYNDESKDISNSSEKPSNYVYVSIPKEIYERLKK